MRATDSRLQDIIDLEEGNSQGSKKGDKIISINQPIQQY